jgi:hypothetical protein
LLNPIYSDLPKAEFLLSRITLLAPNFLALLINYYYCCPRLTQAHLSWLTNPEWIGVS